MSRQKGLDNQRAMPSGINEKKAVIYYSIGCAHLPFALLHVAMGRDVFYLHPRGLLRRPYVRDLIAAAKIRWFDFADFSSVDPADGMRINANLADGFLNILPAEAMNSFVSIFKRYSKTPDVISEKKIRICLFDRLKMAFTEASEVEAAKRVLSQSYGLVHGVFGRCPGLGNLRKSGLLTTPRSGIAPILDLAFVLRSSLAIGLRVATRTVARYFSKTVQMPSALPSEPGAKKSSKDFPRVVYFPHQGPLYGHLFQKDFLYDSDPLSPLHRDNVLHVEYAPPSPNTRLAYEQAELPFRTLLPSGAALTSIRELLPYVWNVFAAFGFAGFLFVDFFSTTAGMYRQFRAYHRQMMFDDNYIAIVGFEQLCPRVLTLALQSVGVRIFAAQERLQSAFYPGQSLILDDYLVAGQCTVDRLASHAYCSIDHLHGVGLVRSDILRSYEAPANHRKRVLVLDYATPVNWWDNTDPLVNRVANKAFYLDIVHLAIDHPDVDFVIRGKSDSWRYDGFFEDVTRVIDILPNLLIDSDYSQLNRSYYLAAQSDCIVAKHTSLGDECLALKKPVIFHDWAPNSKGYSARIYDYDGLHIFAFSYADLTKMLGDRLASPCSSTDMGSDELFDYVFTPLDSAPNVATSIRALIMAEINHTSLRELDHAI